MTEKNFKERLKLISKTIEYVLANVNVGPEDECWEWKGRITRTHSRLTGPSYFRPVVSAFCPMHSTDRKQKAYAYRVVYELAVGPIPEGMTVDHTCFNPLCCNPNHLRLLSLGENASFKVRSDVIRSTPIEEVLEKYKRGEQLVGSDGVVSLAAMRRWLISQGAFKPRSYVRREVLA